MAIIEVKNLTKEYRLGQIQGIKDSIRNLFNVLRARETVKRKKFKALDDINIQVEEGEVLGIIGTNGAGKSTLLKTLAMVTKPTTGTVSVKGSVAPLIEVGAGLHPELTGRENIFLNASILGVSRAEIKNKLDGIVQFAELEDFIDTQVKLYSSGMRIRLGFSIATSVDADILIVDEVLAVGDLAFQRKCFDRMEELIKKSNKTVLMVSHNIRQIERLCTRVLLLDKGRIIAEGDPKEVCTLFYEKSNKKIQSERKASLTGNKVRTSGEIDIFGIDILDSDSEPVESITSGEPLRVKVHFQVNRELEKPEIVVGTHTTDFFYLSAGSTSVFDDRPSFSEGEHVVEYILPACPLAKGTYCIRIAIFDQYRRIIYAGETLKLFEVTANNKEVREAELRTLNLPTVWNIDGATFKTE